MPVEIDEITETSGTAAAPRPVSLRGPSGALVSLSGPLGSGAGRSAPRGAWARSTTWATRPMVAAASSGWCARPMGRRMWR